MHSVLNRTNETPERAVRSSGRLSDIYGGASYECETAQCCVPALQKSVILPKSRFDVFANAYPNDSTVKKKWGGNRRRGDGR